MGSSYVSVMTSTLATDWSSHCKPQKVICCHTAQTNPCGYASFLPCVAIGHHTHMLQTLPCTPASKEVGTGSYPTQLSLGEKGKREKPQQWKRDLFLLCHTGTQEAGLLTSANGMNFCGSTPVLPVKEFLRQVPCILPTKPALEPAPVRRKLILPSYCDLRVLVLWCSLCIVGTLNLNELIRVAESRMP
ncbi:hypothetical protein H8959_018364 [Pygathrix nigripes]